MAKNGVYQGPALPGGQSLALSQDGGRSHLARRLYLGSHFVANLLQNEPADCQVHLRWGRML